MQDRLRRLDALFHVKVLGKSLPGELERDGDECIDCGMLSDPGLPDYTRSLDAAWPAVEQAATSWRVYFERRGDHWLCTLWSESTGTQYRGSGDPAEALVLACLRAVGVDVE